MIPSPGLELPEVRQGKAGNLEFYLFAFPENEFRASVRYPKTQSSVLSPRVRHLLGPNPFVKLLIAQETQPESGFSQCEALVIRLERDLAAFSSLCEI